MLISWHLLYVFTGQIANCILKFPILIRKPTYVELLKKEVKKTQESTPEMPEKKGSEVLSSAFNFPRLFK